MIPFPNNQKLITCLGNQCLENVTGLLRLLQDFFQIKIEHIHLFKIIIIKKQRNVFKTWLCPNFLLLPKKSELPKFWGAAAPPCPRARTPICLSTWPPCHVSQVQKGPASPFSRKTGNNRIAVIVVVVKRKKKWGGAGG